MKFFKNILILALMLPILFVVACKDDENEPTILEPSVVSSSPAANAENVAIDATVEITFNKEMDATTIDATTFTIFHGANKVTGVVSYSDSTATFTPDNHLLASESFVVSLSKNVTDTDGNKLKENFTFSFESGLAPDVTVPIVISTDPASNATDVLFDKVITVTFSEEMDAATINATTFTLKQGATAVAGTVSYAASSASFTPSANLNAGTEYTASVSTGAKDASGIAMVAAKEWSFTTDELPTVSEVLPANESMDVALNAKMSITFSEAMDATTINDNSFTVKQGTSAIAGAVSYADNKATFTPSANLAAGLLYTATVSTDVKNLNGNAIAIAKTWVFTSDALPTVVSVTPMADAIGVFRNTSIAITFSELMDESTITSTSFKVMQANNTVTGTLSFSDKTTTFYPSVALSASLVYTATVSTAVKDLGGNSLQVAKVWSFTTGSVSGLAAVNLRSAANYVILAKTAINNTPNSPITGDMGLSPAATSYITGFGLTDATGYATSPQVTGKVYAADMASPTGSNLTTAVENMLTAYTDAASRPTPDHLNLLSGNIGGQTLQAGLYKWGTTVTIPDDVTISGSADDVWIFQIDNDLTMSAGKNIILSGGAQAKNIFWQVAGEAVIGANSHFEGIILSKTGITLETSASYHGRMLAQTAVILDQNAVTKPD
ncbi:MAG: hypothetical protein ACI82Q_001345 [Nonlabens sp.]|jgi:hypothetical protein